MLSTTVPPINLADVLLVFQAAKREDELAVLQDGRFACLTQGRLELIPEACWDLRSNCLHEQSGDTLDLIARLLKPASSDRRV